MTDRRARLDPRSRRPRAAIYCRISLALFGDTLKVDDQAKMCRQVATQRGWEISEEHVYIDNSRSAWRRNRKRPGWDQMLAAVERGEIDAIIVYHGDRLIRQPWDLEVLIHLANDKGIRLASPTGERDLDNPDDRFILRIEAAQACRESDNTSRRLKRHYERLAEAGGVRLGGRGGRAFGFKPDGVTVEEADAAAIREVADRVLSGEPVGAIARDLNDRGYTTTAGNPWDHSSLRKLMCRARLAGLVSHHSEIVGPAKWPAILDREKWEAVVAVLEHKATGFTYTTNARRYLLSGIALCGTCGAALVVRHNTRGQTLLGYGCINRACARKVHRAVHHLDPYVEGAVVAMLNNPKIRKRMTVPVSGNLAGELAVVEARRRKTVAAFADDEDQDPADLRAALRGLDARLAGIRERIAASQASNVLTALWGIDRAGWQALPLVTRRTAVQRLLRVTVLPAGRRGPGFDPTTVRLEERV